MGAQTRVNCTQLRRQVLSILLFLISFGLLFRSGSALAMPLGEISIHDDSLAAGWQDWSWDATVNLAAAAPTQGGAAAIAVTYTAAWGGFYLHADPPVSTAALSHLRFWVHGGPAGGQKLTVKLNGEEAKTVAVTADAGIWKRVDLPLTALGSPATLLRY